MHYNIRRGCVPATQMSAPDVFNAFRSADVLRKKQYPGNPAANTPIAWLTIPGNRRPRQLPGPRPRPFRERLSLPAGNIGRTAGSHTNSAPHCADSSRRVSMVSVGGPLARPVRPRQHGEHQARSDPCPRITTKSSGLRVALHHRFQACVERLHQRRPSRTTHLRVMCSTPVLPQSNPSLEHTGRTPPARRFESRP